jgi:hypothetical protein
MGFQRLLRLNFHSKRKIKPLERFTKDIQWNGHFNSPEAFLVYYFVDRDKGIVGELSGGISPLHDTFYLFSISVTKQHRRKQYELSMLANIAQFFEVPITPMPEVDRNLVKYLHSTVQSHFQLNAQLDEEHMSAEMWRWQQAANTANAQQRSIG